ncbi:MAG: dihydroorotate dehydrogenase electron transfer subunit [Gammaproteobacteria bacterium]
MTHPSQRNSIFVEDARILSHSAHNGDQYILRVHAPECAAHAKAGQFAHIQCSPALLMRRPLSIMRVDADAGWVDFLYKAVGKGTRLLAERTTGETISILGPIGMPFKPDPQRSRPLLMGGGVGIPPMVFLAETLKQSAQYQPLVLMGSEVPFPFTAQPSKILVPGLPDGVIAAMPLLEDWGIPSRLSSQQQYPGCFDGYISELARHWLDSLDDDCRKTVEIFACGPQPMLEATARLAREYNIPCQVSLEEFMVCAVGGCAGCAVEVTTEEGPAMKRVCVDGPVFDATTVFQ